MADQPFHKENITVILSVISQEARNIDGTVWADTVNVNSREQRKWDRLMEATVHKSLLVNVCYSLRKEKIFSLVSKSRPTSLVSVGQDDLAQSPRNYGATLKHNSMDGPLQRDEGWDHPGVWGSGEAVPAAGL